VSSPIGREDAYRPDAEEGALCRREAVHRKGDIQDSRRGSGPNRESRLEGGLLAELVSSDELARLTVSPLI
jgi:hypothetical protein